MRLLSILSQLHSVICVLCVCVQLVLHVFQGREAKTERERERERERKGEERVGRWREREGGGERRREPGTRSVERESGQSLGGSKDSAKVFERIMHAYLHKHVTSTRCLLSAIALFHMPLFFLHSRRIYWKLIVTRSTSTTSRPENSVNPFHPTGPFMAPKLIISTKHLKNFLFF